MRKPTLNISNLIKASTLTTLLTFLLLITQTAEAALPPLYESIKEITSILNNANIIEQLGSGRPIQSITRTEKGYSIVARECTLEVELKIIPRASQFVGPINFEMIPGKMTCDPKWNNSDIKVNELENSD